MATSSSSFSRSTKPTHRLLTKLYSSLCSTTCALISPPLWLLLRLARERERERGIMGRGKIEIKTLENPTNRQVTYSKRWSGIMKKARELTVLCDAEVSIVMFSSTGKFSDYCSPSTETKKIFYRYQQATGINLWSAQYEIMQNSLNHLKEIKRNLRREI